VFELRLVREWLGCVLQIHTGKASMRVRRIIVLLSQASECQSHAAWLLATCDRLNDVQPGGGYPLRAEQVPSLIVRFSPITG
jgi:hypothetical protein